MTKRHAQAIEAYRSQRLDAFALGGLSLAAWAALVTSDVGPVVEPYSSDLLFVGALVAILGPAMFRLGGTLGTRMGLETTIGLAGEALGLALASALAAVFSSDAMHVVGLTLAFVLVSRAALEVRMEIRLQRAMIARLPRTG